MKDDILSAVVEAEKEIAKKLENEKASSQERLKKLSADSEREIIMEEERLREALNKSIMDSKQRTEKQSSELMKKANSTAAGLDQLDNDILITIIRKHIRGILP